MTTPPFRTTAPPLKAQTVREPRPSPYPWIAFGGLVLAALWMVARIEPQRVTIPAPVVTQPPSTIVVNAVLTLPTPTETAVPTGEPTAKPTRDVSLSWCDPQRPQEGRECQMPPAPTPTTAPRPECPQGPGQWCVWPSVGTNAKQVTQ